LVVIGSLVKDFLFGHIYIQIACDHSEKQITLNMYLSGQKKFINTCSHTNIHMNTLFDGFWYFDLVIWWCYHWKTTQNGQKWRFNTKTSLKYLSGQNSILGGERGFTFLFFICTTDIATRVHGVMLQMHCTTSHASNTGLLSEIIAALIKSGHSTWHTISTHGSASRWPQWVHPIYPVPHLDGWSQWVCWIRPHE